MKKFLFTSFFLFLAYFSFSQVQFNKTDTLFSGPTMRNIVIQGNNYFTVGGSSLDGKLRIVICKFDNFGELLSAKYYLDTITWFHGIEGSLKETETNNYILGAQRKINWYSDNKLIKFDANFDTIFTKTYYPVDDNGYKDVITYGSCVGKDTSYLLVGLTNIANNYDSLYQYQMQLIKTDTMGNLLWRKTYGNDTIKHYGYKVVNAFDGGYLLGGWAYFSATNNGDWAIVKVDENGENPIFKYFGNPSYDEGRVMGITLTSDSCYLITGAYGVGYYAGYTTTKARILKLDKNLNTVWDRLYLKPSSTTFFYEALEKQDSNLFAYGANRNVPNYKMSVIMELTSEGDSIWRQETTSCDTVHTDNNLESCKLTPDGGMVFGGYTYNSASLSPPQQMWLVKTDSMGCDGTEWTCDINYLEEFASKESGLRVWPNPTKSTLFVELNSTVIASEERAKQSLNNTRHYEEYSNEIPSYKQIASPCGFAMTLSKEQFSNLPIDQKLKYNIAHPKQNYWTEKEEQEMQELSRQLAYAFPFEVIKGKVDIFSIDPALKAAVIASEAWQSQQTQRHYERSSLSRESGGYRGIDNELVTIYDIFGRLVKTNVVCHSEQSEESVYTINVSQLQNGVYFVKVGNSVAKFVKE